MKTKVQSVLHAYSSKRTATMTGATGPTGTPGVKELDILIKKSSITGTTGSQNIPFNTQIVPSMSCPLSTSVIIN